jgi:hypothetical protein
MEMEPTLLLAAHGQTAAVSILKMILSTWIKKKFYIKFLLSTLADGITKAPTMNTT